MQAAQLSDEQIEAKLARPDRVLEVLPLVRAPHAAQGDALAAMARSTSRRGRTAAGGPGRRSAGAPLAGRPKSQSGGEVERRRGVRGLLGFSGEVRSELAKVDFPNRQQTWQSTMVVVAACILVGGYLYGLDQAFAHLASKLIDLQK
jgi:preprotein translocase SecE subunit